MKLKLLDLAKRILGMRETVYRATFAGAMRYTITLTEDGRVLVDCAWNAPVPAGYLCKQEKARLKACKWSPPLPPEVRRQIWTECHPGEHRPQAMAAGPFQRCRDCGADLQAERECPACKGTGCQDGTSDECRVCERTGQLGWREVE
jgi:hypothetical protein